MRCFVLLALFAAALAAATEEECEKMAETCFENVKDPLVMKDETCNILNDVPLCLKSFIPYCAESDEEKAEAAGFIKHIEAGVGLICGEPCITPDDIMPALSLCVETLQEFAEVVGEEDEEEENAIAIELSEADAQCILGAFLTECTAEVVEDKCGDLIAEGFKQGMIEGLIEGGVGEGSELCEIPKEQKKKRHVLKRAIKKSTVFKRFAKYRRSSRK